MESTLKQKIQLFLKARFCSSGLPGNQRLRSQMVLLLINPQQQQQQHQQQQQQKQQRQQ